MASPTMKLLAFLRPRRRWLQFSLGTLLLVVTLLCIWLADYVSPVRKLERQLGDPDEEVRELAAEKLGYLGPEARSATRSLVRRAMEDTSSLVRLKAVWALSRVSGRSDLLEPLLTDSDSDVRLAALEGLLWLGEDPAKVLHPLLELVWEAGDSIFPAMGREQAATVIPFLLDSLPSAKESELSGLNRPVARALEHVAMPAPTVVPALIERLHHDRPQVRRAAAEQLLRLGASAKAAIPDLRSRLDDPDAACAAACAATLRAIDPTDAESLRVLKESLRSGDVGLNYNVGKYLWLLRPNDTAMLDDLVEFVCDSHRSGGWPSFAASALVRTGPLAVEPLDRALRDAMSERDDLPRTQEGLRERMANIAWVSLPVVRSLLERARGAPADGKQQQDLPDDVPRRNDRTVVIRFLQQAEEKLAARATPNRHALIPIYLGMLGRSAKPAAPTLVKSLDYPDFRFYSLRVLADLGEVAAPAVPRLVRFLDSDDRILRRTALHALAKIGGSDDGVRAKVRPDLASSDRYKRCEAAQLMAGFGEPVDQILPVLLELAIDPHFSRHGEGLPMGESFSPGVRDGVIDSIALLGDAALPALIAALHDRDPKVRRAAADALGKIGPSASAAVPHLTELLDDEHAWPAAAEALGRIGPEAREAVPKFLEALEAMRSPPDPADYDPEEYDPDEYVWRGYDPNEYFPRLDALAGIGREARSAVPEVMRIANFDDRSIRQAAILTLSRIDPRNPSLVSGMRRLLIECERKSATEDLHVTWIRGDPLEKVAEAIWDLGPHAEPLALDLDRIVRSKHLVQWKVRCFAAFALASFPQHRRRAEAYLESVVDSGFPASPESINLAHGLLQRIKGVPKNEIRPVVVLWGGP